MKKIGSVILTIVLVAGLSVSGFAAKAHTQPKKVERIVAQVVSLDVPGKTIGITEEKTGASRTIHISAKAASQLKVGDRVRIKLKPGTDESMGVLVLKPKDAVGAPVEAPEAMTTATDNQVNEAK
jgi:hypothetical protein